MLQDVIDALRRKAPEAVALAREEVAATPDGADAHHLLGMALRESGDFAGARGSLERAIELAPDTALYHFSRALLAWDEGDHGNVDRASAHALALDPNQTGAYVLRIQLALAGNDLAEAERQFNLAERVDPGHPQLLSIAGQIALAKGDPQAAIDRLRRAQQSRPHDPQLLTLLGMAWLQQGHPAFAEQSLRNAKAIDPRGIDSRRLLVQALLSQGRRDEAGAELDDWRRVHPHDTGVALIAGELNIHDGNPQAALADFRKLLHDAPEPLPALIGIERALNAIGDVELARRTWEDCLHQLSDSDQIWINRLTVAADVDDRREVLRRWRQALPDSAAAYLNQAWQDDADEQFVAAEAGYDAVLARAPTQAEALFGKAMHEWRRDADAAYARLTALVASAPPWRARPAVAVRGLVLDRIERTADAVADWAQAQAGMGQMPALAPLPVAALGALPLPAAATGNDDPVVLLWGPPGSGSERLAAALRHAPSRPLMLAMGQMAPRIIPLPEEFLARALDPAQLPGVAAEVAGEYAQSVAPHQRAGNLGVFDWHAVWDARPVPTLRHALPRLRLLAVLRDPRDLLLNWLAFGAPVGPSFGDPVASAHWLANQIQHLLFSRDVLGLPVQIVDMDRFDAQPAAAMQEIATFADLPSAPSADPALRLRSGPGRAPALLPAGRWRAYRDVLGEAFAVLTVAATALAYPAD